MTMEFFPEVYLTDMDAELIARGLMAVARADGVVLEREAAMIRMFFADISSESVTRMGNLERESTIDAKIIGHGLSRGDVSTLFLKSCFLVAYADGECASSERALIETFAEALGTDKTLLAKIEESVKEYLLRQLAHVQNVDAVAKVAKSLRL
jgi:tellurite resistance protein